MTNTVKPQTATELLGKPNLRILTTVRDHTSGLLYAVPYLRALRRHLPHAHISLLANAYAASIVHHCPYIDQIVPFFSFNVDEQPARRFGVWKRRARAWRQLAGQVDLAVHFRNVGSNVLLFAASLGNPFQIGYRQHRFNRFLDINLGVESLNTTSRQRNARILDALGISSSPEMEIWITTEEREWARQFLESQGWQRDEPLFVLHPGSHWGCNEWIPERWASLGVALQSKYGGKLLLTGSAQEQQVSAKIADALQTRPLIATGRTTLRRFAALLSEATLVISVDSAPTQICQALSQPAVIIMGAGNPCWNAPVAGEPMIVLQEPESASADPFLCDFASGHCHGPECRSRAAGIQVTDVLRAADHLLRAQQSGEASTPAPLSPVLRAGRKVHFHTPCTLGADCA